MGFIGLGLNNVSSNYLVFAQEVMGEVGQHKAKFSCSQLFGYKSKSQKLLEEDNITTLKFDPSGRFLALGDKAGRLIVFQSPQQLQQQQQYGYYEQFEAHQPDFDPLKNLNISGEISHIDWMRPQGKYLRLLTANTHSVKLWKMYQKTQRKVVENATEDLEMPYLEDAESTVCVNLCNRFVNQSFSPINSCGLLDSEQYMYTADQEALFLWNLQKPDRPFLLRDLKAGGSMKMEKTDKITCAALHPKNQSLFGLGTYRGELSVIDSRVSLNNAGVLQFKSRGGEGHFISEIIKQYTSVRFLADSRKVVTRDLISLKVWDLCNNREPLLDIHIDQDIKHHLHDLFEGEVLEDRFGLSEANGNIITGNYGNSFQIVDPSTGQNVHYELDFGQETKVRHVGQGQRSNPFSCVNRVFGHDYNDATGQLAVSTSSCFFIYSQQDTLP